MKNVFSKLATLTGAVALAMFCMSSCSVSDLTKDLTVYTANNFLVSPISIQIADAAHLESVPNGLAVTIEGRDKAKIFSLMGEYKINPLSGIVALAVKSADAPTVANPLEFTVVVSAPNYVTVRKNYVLTSKSALSTDKVAMINLTATPEGVSVQNTSFASTTTGTTKAFAFSSPLSAGKTEQASITVNVGTQTLTVEGNVVEGTIQTQLVHHDARSEASLSGLVEGFDNLALKTAGTSITTVKASIVPAGFYSMTMTSGGKIVSKFSTPLDVTMDIDPNYFSSVHNRKIQAGDVLDVISRTENETAWALETKATVVSVNGQLKVKFKQPHLSIWIIGELTQPQDVCLTQLKINSQIPPTATFEDDDGIGDEDFDDCTGKTIYGYKLVNAKNPNIVYLAGRSYLGNGDILDNTVRSDNKINVLFIVYDDNTQAVIYTSPEQNLCNNPSINLIGKLPANKTIVARVNVSTYCQGDINTIFVPHNVALWFRDMASPPNAPFGGWAPLTTIVNGKTCAKGLIAGHFYDFALPIINTAGQFELQKFSKELKQPLGCPVPLSGDIVVKVISPVYNINKTLTIKQLPDGMYDMTFENYELPTNICDELNKKYKVFIKKTGL